MPQPITCCAAQTDFVLDQTLTNVPSPLPCPVVPDTVVLPSGATTNTLYGASMKFSADGRTLVVGAPKYAATSAVGAAFVYRKLKPDTRICVGKTDLNQFALQQILFNPSLELNNDFGSQVAISANGRRIVVTALNQTVATLVGAGSAYVFDLVDCSRCFTLTQTLTAEKIQDGEIVPDTSAGARFGFALALSGDGQVAAITSLLSGEPDVGTVYLYSVEPSNTCLKQAKPLAFATKLAFDPAETLALTKKSYSSNDFGYSLSLSFDGSVLLIGDPYAENVTVPLTPVATGIAYLYKKVVCQRDWTLRQVFVEQPETFVESEIGADVAVSADGNQLFVFSSFSGTPETPFTIVLERLKGKSVYSLQQFVIGSTSQTAQAPSRNFRTSFIAINGKGCFLAIGFNTAVQSSGQVALYKRCSVRSLFGDVAQTLVEPGTPAQNQFGSSVAMSADGKTLSVASFVENVYVYESETVHCK